MSLTHLIAVNNMSNKKGQGTVHPKKAKFDCELDEDAVTVENNGKVFQVRIVIGSDVV